MQHYGLRNTPLHPTAPPPLRPSAPPPLRHSATPPLHPSLCQPFPPYLGSINPVWQACPFSGAPPKGPVQFLLPVNRPPPKWSPNGPLKKIKKSIMDFCTAQY
ncbi:hypothetical protein Vafri_16046, partial [Volvox africanus]